MKSWWIRTADNAMALELRDIPIPQPGPGQVCIRIRAASLNRGEFIAGHGLHTAATARPAGFEAAGEVTALGADVTRWKLGDRVMGRCDGAFAEHGCMNAEEVFAAPQRLTWEQAAATTVVFLTVYEALMAHGRLAAGETMLVTGISSGVGVASLQVGKALGARVIGTSGSLEKLERLKALGAEGTKSYVVTGGFAEISATGVSVLAERAVPVEEATPALFDALVAEARDAARRIGGTRPDLPDVMVLGPAPALLSLLRGRYRYRLLINARRSAQLQDVIREWLGKLDFPQGVRVSVDIDPYSFV